MQSLGIKSYRQVADKMFYRQRDGVNRQTSKNDAAKGNQTSEKKEDPIVRKQTVERQLKHPFKRKPL